jgi:hypothetical protein
MKVTDAGQYLDILPTGADPNDQTKYMSPMPLKAHTTFYFTDTHVYLWDLFNNHKFGCVFADFEGEPGPITNPDLIKDHLLLLLP